MEFIIQMNGDKSILTVFYDKAKLYSLHIEPSQYSWASYYMQTSKERESQLVLWIKQSQDPTRKEEHLLRHVGKKNFT